MKCTVDLARLDLARVKSDAKYLNELYVFTSNLLLLSIRKSTPQRVSSLYCETLLALCRFEPFDAHKDAESTETNFEQKQSFIKHLFLEELSKSNQNKSENDKALDLQVSAE